MARKSLVLGIDGGIQKSVGLLSDDLGTIFARREGAAMNVGATGFDNVAAEVPAHLASSSSSSSRGSLAAQSAARPALTRSAPPPRLRAGRT